MAIDFNEVQITADLMSEKSGEFQALVREAADGVHKSRHLGEKPFTLEEKTNLKGQYDTLKVELATLYNQLP